MLAPNNWRRPAKAGHYETVRLKPLQGSLLFGAQRDDRVERHCSACGDGARGQGGHGEHRACGYMTQAFMRLAAERLEPLAGLSPGMAVDNIAYALPRSAT